MTPSLHRTDESDLEKKFHLAVRRDLGGKVFKLAPTVKGIPDRLVLLPGGEVHLVELKAADGTVSPAQRVWHDRAAALGTRVVVLYGWRDILGWLRRQAR